MANTEVFSFLITTDNHLGFKENDHIRCNDSYMAFEEALRIAREHDVDFILLGGDLFHVSRPSAEIEHKCIKIIRKHMNANVDRDVSFRRVDGEFSHFDKIKHANFEDHNFKVPYPIMTIHGNHDDPTGPNSRSVCEKLATSGLLNYFGATTSKLENIVINPIILVKGKIKIALYGIGFIPDDILQAKLNEGKISFKAFPSDTFNVLVVHQNRIPFNKRKYIPDDIFPTKFHLIIRGHEHQTLSPEPIPGSEVSGMVYQPGSTVATSISAMESGPKQVGVISIGLNKISGDCNGPYKMSYSLIGLKNCRSMLIKDIRQKDLKNHMKKEINAVKIPPSQYKALAKNFVERSITELLKAFNGSQSPKKTFDDDLVDSNCLNVPLLRVRLEYTSKSERFDEREISSLFYPEQVANKSIVTFKKQKLRQVDGVMESATFADFDDHDDEDEDEFEHIDLGQIKSRSIDNAIREHFAGLPIDEQLQALSISDYVDAVIGSTEDVNVTKKVLERKKQLVLKEYKNSIHSETDAQEKFHDEAQVHNWFLKTLTQDRSVNIIEVE